MAETEADLAALRSDNERLRRRIAELETEDQSHRQYVRVLESLPQKLFLKDCDGRFVMVNDAFAALVGKPRDWFVGRGDHDICPPDLADKYIADDQRVMRSRTAVTLVEPNDVGETRRFVEVTKAPVFDDRDEVVGVVGIFQDVTGRVRAESQLRQSRKLVQAILDNSPAVVTIKDAVGKYVMANRRFSEVFGLHQRDVIGKTDHDLFPNLDADQYRKNDEYVLRTGRSLEIEEQVPLKDGPHTFIVLKFPVETANGQTVSVGGISTDITERKQGERLLRESETRKSAILDAALDCILAIDYDGMITEFNPAAEREFGLSRSAAAGRPLEDFLGSGQWGKGDGWKVGGSGERRALFGRHVEAVARRADGSIFPAEVGVTTIALHGRPHTIVTIRNITKRKDAEAAIDSQRRQLREQAAELEARNKELSLAYSELQNTETQLIHSEKMAAIGQLVAGLAHEINTPVAYVLTNLANIGRDADDVIAFARGCLDLMPELEGIDPVLAGKFHWLRDEHGIEDAAAEIRPLLEAAQKGMGRIRDIVATLRSYSRIDLRSETAFEDLNEGIRATLVMLNPLKRPGIDIEVDLMELPRIECNLGKINQVILNLLTNSAQALGQAGTIRVSSRPAEGGVEVRVKDNGPGIPLDVQKRVFDPFFTTKPVGEGTGLGLSISRRIVEAHHGSLTFATEAGAGTEFRLFLPIRQPTTAAMEESQTNVAIGE